MMIENALKFNNIFYFDEMEVSTVACCICCRLLFAFRCPNKSIDQKSHVGALKEIYGMMEKKDLLKKLSKNQLEKILIILNN